MSLFAKRKKDSLDDAMTEKILHDLCSADAVQQKFKELRWQAMGKKAFEHRYGRGQFRDDDHYDDDEYDN